MKWNIVNFSTTVIFGAVSVVGLIYTVWPSTDPYLIVAGVYVSEDMITLGLLLLGAIALSIPLILVGRLLWPAVRQLLKTRRRRFEELAPELRELQQMTKKSERMRTMPSIEHRTRTLLLLGRLKALGIDCSPDINIESELHVWRTLEECFEALAVLADADRLDTAKIAAKSFRGEISDYIGEGSRT